MDLWLFDFGHFPESLANSILDTFPPSIADSIRRFRRMEDKKSRIIARLLIQKYVTDQSKFWDWNTWMENEHHKPGIKGGPFFSISHSGTKVLVGFSETAEIGVDLEEIKPIDVSVLMQYFHPTEKAFLSANAYDLNHFYAIWTKKEAVLKASGIGLLKGLDHLNVLDQDPSVNRLLTEINLGPEFKCAVCSLSEGTETKLHLIDHNILNKFIHEKILL